MNNLAIKNAAWIVLCKVIQSVISLVLGMLTARYLGPSNYGLISYASSMVAFFVPVMQLGFNALLVQELISRPDEEGVIVGTSVVSCLFSGLFCVLGVLIFTSFVNIGETETILVCFLYSLTLFFRAGEMVTYWFQAKLMSKYSSLISLIAYMVISIYKICILYYEKGIMWFAITHVIETFIISILLIVAYIKMGNQRLFFSLEKAKEMFSRSKYYIWSGLMVVIFQQTDKIMLKLMLNETETGYYSAALTCIGIPAFIFSAIIDSGRPLVLEGKKISTEEYERRLVLLFGIVSILALSQSIVMTLLADVIMGILFGKAYLPASSVLQIAVWYITFGYFGVVRNIWILGENKQNNLPKINVFGALMNVLCNFFLIPIMGARGAALASVLTQFCVNFVLCFLIKDIKPVGKIIIKSLDFRIIKNFVEEYTRRN